MAKSKQKHFLTEEQMMAVYAETRRYIALFVAKIGDDLDHSVRQLDDITFDATGASAGTFKREHSTNRWTINYNEELFATHWRECFDQTIPHEVAHYICYAYNAGKNHDAGWKAVMRLFGKEPKVYHSMDVSVVTKGRRLKRFTYQCACAGGKGTHQLTTIRHNRIRNEGKRYRCKDCKQALKYIK